MTSSLAGPLPEGIEQLKIIVDSITERVAAVSQDDLDNILILDSPERALRFLGLLTDFKYFPNIGLLSEELSCNLINVVEAIIYLATNKEVRAIDPVGIFNQVDVYFETKILAYLAAILHPYKEGNMNKNQVYFTFKGLLSWEKDTPKKVGSFQSKFKSDLLTDYYNKLKADIETSIRVNQYEGSYESFIKALMAGSDYDNFIGVQKLFFPKFLNMFSLYQENKPHEDKKLRLLIPLFEVIAPEWRLEDIDDAYLRKSSYNSQYDRKIHIIKSKLR